MDEQAKQDLMRQAEEAAAKGEREARPERRPGEKAYHYFMGGANAGDVLMNKTAEPVKKEDSEQITLEYLTDLNDLGDFGALKNIIAEHGFAIIPTVPVEEGKVRCDTPI